MVKFSQESEDIDSKKKISDIRAQELIKLKLYYTLYIYNVLSVVTKYNFI